MTKLFFLNHLQNYQLMIGEIRDLIAPLYLISRQIKHVKMFDNVYFFLYCLIHVFCPFFCWELPCFFITVSMNKGMSIRILTPSHICKYFSKIIFFIQKFHFKGNQSSGLFCCGQEISPQQALFTIFSSNSFMFFYSLFFKSIWKYFYSWHKIQLTNFF